MYSLGGVCIRQWKWNEGREYTTEAAELCEEVFGIDHPRTQQLIGNVVQLQVLEERIRVGIEIFVVLGSSVASGLCFYWLGRRYRTPIHEYAGLLVSWFRSYLT